jgi:hypothetical protein
MTPLGFGPRARSEAMVPLREGAMEVRVPAGRAPAGGAARPASTTSTSPAAAPARLIRLRLAGATRVELMADFTDWQPMELEGRGGVWERAVPLAPGTYRLLIRIDGGEWVAPPGLAVVDDDFGGKVGLLVVH